MGIYVFYWSNGSILLTLNASTIFNVYCYTWHHEIGFARLARRLGWGEEESADADDVILPYIFMCLITLGR